MSMDIDKIRQILATARDQGQKVLLETDGLALLQAMEIAVPAHLLVRNAEEAAALKLPMFPEDRAVLKVISPRILHKSDVGGVSIVPNRRDTILSGIRALEQRFRGEEIEGFTINQFISYDRALGHEILLGMRWTDDFGAVVTYGAGGIYTEFLARNFKSGRDIAIFSPAGSLAGEIGPQLNQVAITAMITGQLRGQRARVEITRLVDVVAKFLALARECVPAEISEFEINPLVVTEKGLLALDVLLKLGDGHRPAPPTRPVEKLRNLLEPQSAALIGVSEKMNPGHIILNNMIREGFDKERIYLVKPGADQIEGCRCYPDVASLPQKVDLFILSIAAAEVPEVITDVLEGEKAESLIVIPGGLEEKQGTDALVGRMRAALDKARRSDWKGPLINGGNCLGVRSHPGRYDTLFIPGYKLPVPKGMTSPVALVSQSGAFAVSKTSKLAGINPKYIITVGNQMDLTIGDYMTHLKDDPEIEIYAVYIEGFKPLDGLAFLEAARAITDSGRTVILCRAGRTAAGAHASASHTASIAGDYAVTRALCASAGIILAEGIDDFEDLTRLFAFLRDKEVPGWGLGAISNAGFECVAIADNLGRFDLPAFRESTSDRLRAVFTQCRIEDIVDVHNPIDLTPMAADQAYEDAVRAIMEDEGVGAGIVGCVPLTPALATLPRSNAHREDLYDEKSMAMRMVRLKREIGKAWVAVVDGGAIYDPMARLLEENGVPTFRTADRALRLFNIFCGERLKRTGARQA